jgi:hypothetical protein
LLVTLVTLVPSPPKCQSETSIDRTLTVDLVAHDSNINKCLARFHYGHGARVQCLAQFGQNLGGRKKGDLIGTLEQTFLEYKKKIYSPVEFSSIIAHIPIIITSPHFTFANP